MLNLLQIELYKISRRSRTYIAFAAITAIVVIFQFAFKADGKSYMDLMLQSVQDSFEIDKSKAINGYFMCYIILNTLLIQVPILVALIAGDAISGEANMGTLRLLLTKPVSRTKLILIKFTASFIYTMMLLVWMAVMALFVSLLIFGADDMLIFRVKGTAAWPRSVTNSHNEPSIDSSSPSSNGIGNDNATRRFFSVSPQTENGRPALEVECRSTSMNSEAECISGSISASNSRCSRCSDVSSAGSCAFTRSISAAAQRRLRSCVR
jgi:hypothetical protein